MISLLGRLFPPPNYILRPAAGLDLSDRSIKVMEFYLGATGLKVKKFGEMEIPAGIIEGGEIKNELRLVTSLKELKEKYSLNWVACDLPEEFAYVVRLKLPKTRPADLPGMIEVELPEHVPLSPGQIVFDFIPASLDETGKWVWVDVAAASRAVVESYERALLAAGLKPVSFEMEAAALARTIFIKGDRQTTLVVDIGKVRTGFSIVSCGVVLDTTTVAGVSGDAFTELIRRALKASLVEAEERKIKFGLSRVNNNREQFFALLPLVSALGDEIKKRISFWLDHGSNETSTTPVTKIVLVGGQATLPGLIEYLAASTNLPVELGNPWIGVLETEKSLPPIPFNEALRYSVAIGLALRSFNNL